MKSLHYKAFLRYVIPFGPYKGKRLSELPRLQLILFHNQILETQVKTKVQRDFVDIARQYILKTM